VPESKNHAPTPYGLTIPDSCVTCALRQQGFFCALPVSVLRDFEKLRASTLLPKNAVIFVEGGSPRGMYMLCEGTVKLSTTTLNGKSMILKLASAGEILGLSACLSGLPYALTAQTHTPCHISFLPRREFLRFLRLHGEACLQAAKFVSERRIDAVNAIRNMSVLHHANERFAQFLLSLDKNGSNEVTVTMTHEEIAEVLGISRETVTRAFFDFKKADWIAVRGRSVFIRDRGALQKLLAA